MYVHIESLLRQKIVTGQLEPGERLLTERDLAAGFGVSQITVRTALANLEAEKLIVRRRGKGTFVSPTVPVREKIIVTGDIQSFARDAERYEVKVVGIETKKVNQTRVARDLQGFFDIGADGDITVIRRVRLLQGNPVSFIENFISSEVARNVTEQDLSEHLLQKILADKSGVSIGKSESYLESVPAEADVAELLHSHMFAPLFLLTAHLWLSSGEPLQVVHVFMRPEYYKYKIDSERRESTE